MNEEIKEKIETDSTEEIIESVQDNDPISIEEDCEGFNEEGE